MSASEPGRTHIESLSDLFSDSAKNLLSAKGPDLVRQIGLEVVRGVVLDVLTGRNLRDSTEILTRRRIASLNLAICVMFLKGSTHSSKFIEDLPSLASDILLRKSVSKNERWLAQWVLGLTDKAFQNVLRDSPEAIAEYRDRYVQACRDVIANSQQEYGLLQGEISLGSGVQAQINWAFITYLLGATGAQTLAIRGSEKSAYGKLFEKLVLGSLLLILGFKRVSPDNPESLIRVFWLSSREEKRESDATLLYRAGKGVRFDIGFIGRGNPEISLDKVSRFEREISLGRSKWYMATIILVDRIGMNSRIERMAKAIDGTIIQMSMGYWPQQVAQQLSAKLGFKHELAKMRQSEIAGYLKEKLATVPIQEFIPKI